MTEHEPIIERKTISLSITKNDHQKLKALANYNETSASAFLSRCIKDEYNKIKDDL